MHLAQHHFQTQNRYFEDVTRFVMSELFFRSYGLAGCELSAEALLNGTVSLVHARGVMPDGLAFHFPEDPLPKPLEIREIFSPTQESHLVMLAIPRFRPGGSNCVVDLEAPANGSRFVLRQVAIADETTGRDEKPVGLAGKNFRLMLDVQVTEDLVALPLARVRRDGAGHFIYDPAYIPPVLQIGGSLALLEMLARLVEMLDARAEALMAERRTVPTAQSEYATREIASFWLSHAIHASLGPLRHFLQTRSCHPEQLYAELSRLGGALCTFSLEAHPRMLPAYEHEQLERCFVALDRHIRAHLDTILPTRCVKVPLAEADRFLYTGMVTDRRCYARAQWYLGVRSSATHGEVIARVPKLVKVCSAKFIVRLVKEAHPGLVLEHVPSPPAELSPRIGTQYFRIQTAGPCWTTLHDTHEMGVYVPAAIPDAELELSVVLDA
jgi:type VI secretion system protein ImpJ